MLPNDTANITDGTSNHVYGLTTVGVNSSVRSESAAPADQPATLSIAHQTSGKGVATVRRTKVRFDRTYVDGDDSAKVSVYMVIEHPLQIATDAQVIKSVNELVALTAVSGYLAKIVGGEI